MGLPSHACALNSIMYSPALLLIRILASRVVKKTNWQNKEVGLLALSVGVIVIDLD